MMEQLTRDEFELLEIIKASGRWEQALGELTRLLLLGGSVYLGSHYGLGLVVIIGMTVYSLIRIHDLMLHFVLTEEFRSIASKLIKNRDAAGHGRKSTDDIAA
jgi:hypothetical protein